MELVLLALTALLFQGYISWVSCSLTAASEHLLSQSLFYPRDILHGIRKEARECCRKGNIFASECMCMCESERESVCECESVCV